MAGSPTKKGNWGTWAVIDNPPPKEGTRCGGCVHYNEDGSCNVLPVVLHNVGGDFWKTCKKYSNTLKAARKTEKASLTDKQNAIKGKKPCKFNQNDGRCTLWNSGYTRCCSTHCVYYDAKKYMNRTCSDCKYSARSKFSTLVCKKSHKPIQEKDAAYCSFFIQRQDCFSLEPQELTVFTDMEKAALRQVKNKGLFQDKRVLLTGRYSKFTREEAMALLDCLGVNLCIEPEDADIVVQAKTGQKTYKLKAAQLLVSCGKPITLLTEEEFITEFKRLLKS